MYECVTLHGLKSDTDKSDVELDESCANFCAEFHGWTFPDPQTEYIIVVAVYRPKVSPNTERQSDA